MLFLRKSHRDPCRLSPRAAWLSGCLGLRHLPLRVSSTHSILNGSWRRYSVGRLQSGDFRGEHFVDAVLIACFQLLQRKGIDEDTDRLVEIAPPIETNRDRN